MARAKSRKRQASQMPPAVDPAAWLMTHNHELICCPHQPGNLKLLPRACAKRFEIANQPRWMNTNGDTFVMFLFKANLIPCRQCGIGAGCASASKGKAA